MKKLLFAFSSAFIFIFLLFSAPLAHAQQSKACQDCLQNNPSNPGNCSALCTPSYDCNNIGGQSLDLAGCYKLNSSETVANVFNSPAVMINLLVKVGFIFAGIICFILLIYSGYLFIFGGVKGQEQAGGVFSSMLIGLIIMFSAYWILQIIKIVTGADIGF